MTYLDKQLYALAAKLEMHQVEASNLQGQDKLDNIQQQSDIKGWFVDQYTVLERLSRSQLNLTH
jgi:hypothetical protein